MRDLSIFRRNVPAAAVEKRKEEFARKVEAFRAATGNPERFSLQCACAATDRPFTVIFERTNPTHAFRIAAIEKATGNGAPAAAARERLCSAEDLDLASWRCPHCGNTDGLVVCEQCSTVVCAARIRREGGTQVFFCRNSCGGSGGLGPLREITGTDGRPQAQPASLPRPGAQQALPPPAPGVLPKPAR